FRQLVVSASGNEPAIAEAPAIVALTSTWWRNAWKYQARAYRHAFWDGGTLLANLLAVACGQAIPASVVIGFVDSDVNRLLDVDPSNEAAVALVALGKGSAAPVAHAPEIPPLDLQTRRLSAHVVDYPEIVAAHAASSQPSGAAAAGWRASMSGWKGSSRYTVDAAGEAESIESVILRRGSSRRFTREPISIDSLEVMLRAATASIHCDAFVASQPYLIVNAINGLEPGAYVFSRVSGALELLKSGDFRREAAYLDLGQELAGDAAVDVYWLVNLDELDNRG